MSNRLTKNATRNEVLPTSITQAPAAAGTKAASFDTDAALTLKWACASSASIDGSPGYGGHGEPPSRGAGGFVREQLHQPAMLSFTSTGDEPFGPRPAYIHPDSSVLSMVNELVVDSYKLPLTHSRRATFATPSDFPNVSLGHGARE